MHKLSEVFKKPIVSLADGKELGKPKDAILDQEAKSILAFLIKGKKILPFTSIKAIGSDAITVESEQVIIKADQDPTLKQAVEDKNKVKGKKLISEDGTGLGKVADLLFDEMTGQIADVEASQGKIKDLKQGGPIATPVEGVLNVGQEAVLMQKVTAMQPEKDVMHQPSPSAPSSNSAVAPPPPQPTAAQQVKDKAGGILESVKEKMNEMKEKVTQKTDGMKEQKILGKPSTLTVLDAQDNVVLKKDEIITHQAIESAKKAGAKESIYQAGEGK